MKITKFNITLLLIIISISYSREKLNILYQNDWLDEAEKWMLEYENSLLKMTSSFEHDPDLLNLHRRWTFIGAFYYCLALVTTLGDNNSPKTTRGKLFAIIYASVGVPLMLVVLSNCSCALVNAIKLLQRQITAIPDRKRDDDKVQTNVHYRLIDNTRKSLSVEVKNCGKGPVITKILTEIPTNSSVGYQPIENGYVPNYVENKSKNIVYENDRNCDKDITNENSFVDSKIETQHFRNNDTTIVNNNVRTTSFAILCVIMLLSVIYLIIGSLIISIWKDCPYLEAISFGFLTIITIGYNDSFRKYLYKLDVFNNLYYSIFLCSFLFFGLTLLIAVLTVFSEKIRSICYNSKTSLQHNTLL